MTSAAIAHTVVATTAAQGKATLATANAFLGAFGKADIEAMKRLMADDMVWHNEGDKSVPWIGHWAGKENVLKFLTAYGNGFKTTAWNPEDAITSGDTAAYFGTMNGQVTRTGKATGTFTYALRGKVRDGKVVLWNWFEDSFAVSKANE